MTKSYHSPPSLAPFPGQAAVVQTKASPAGRVPPPPLAPMRGLASPPAQPKAAPAGRVPPPPLAPMRGLASPAQPKPASARTVSPPPPMTRSRAVQPTVRSPAQAGPGLSPAAGYMFGSATKFGSPSHWLAIPSRTVGARILQRMRSDEVTPAANDEQKLASTLEKLQRNVIAIKNRMADNGLSKYKLNIIKHTYGLYLKHKERLADKFEPYELEWLKLHSLGNGGLIAERKKKLWDGKLRSNEASSIKNSHMYDAFSSPEKTLINRLSYGREWRSDAPELNDEERRWIERGKVLKAEVSKSKAHQTQQANINGLPGSSDWRIHNLSEKWDGKGGHSPGDIVPIWSDGEKYYSCNITSTIQAGLGRFIWMETGRTGPWITLDHYKTFIELVN
jgi:hypothetical protein